MVDFENNELELLEEKRRKILDQQNALASALKEINSQLATAQSDFKPNDIVMNYPFIGKIINVNPREIYGKWINENGQIRDFSTMRLADMRKISMTVEEFDLLVIEVEKLNKKLHSAETTVKNLRERIKKTVMERKVEKKSEPEIRL